MIDCNDRHRKLTGFSGEKIIWRLIDIMEMIISFAHMPSIFTVLEEAKFAPLYLLVFHTIHSLYRTFYLLLYEEICFKHRRNHASCTCECSNVSAADKWTWTGQWTTDRYSFSLSLTFELHQNLKRTWHRPWSMSLCCTVCSLQCPLSCVVPSIWLSFSFFHCSHSALTHAWDRYSISFIIHCSHTSRLAWDTSLCLHHCVYERTAACVFIVSIGQV